MRICRNKTGPGEVRRMSSAASMRTGNAQSSKAAEQAMSNERLTTIPPNSSINREQPGPTLLSGDCWRNEAEMGRNSGYEFRNKLWKSVLPKPGKTKTPNSRTPNQLILNGVNASETA